jgi:ribosomal protein S18 acetylase RimI-like enzyme
MELDAKPPLPPGYELHRGKSLDRAQVLTFLQHTYQELYPGHPVAHLAQTVDQYLSPSTPLWWVRFGPSSPASPPCPPVAGLWAGTAVDQITGDRHAHIFLLYVLPDHRRQGLARALMAAAEQWAQQRGDRQIGLQVFTDNQPARALYQTLGYAPQSLWLVKPLPSA